MSSSSSFGSSSSVSSTEPVETNENNIMDAIAGVASNYANQLFDWASNTFAQTSNITNQAISNFFDTSSKMEGFASGMTNQYNNLFAPENAQLVADANSYASPARMKTDMGMAGATQAMADRSALNNSEEALRSYGMNPGDGRYVALDKAAAVQSAADNAGAQNMQRMADIQTGQALRTQAVQVGAQLPQAITNARNTEIQANTGAENSSLGNANTGANMYQVPDKYLSTGMQVKLPFSSTHGSSVSSNQSNSSGPGSGSGSGSGGGGSGGGGSGGGGSGGAWMPDHSAAGSEGFRPTGFGNGGPGGGPTDPPETDPPPGPETTTEPPWAWPPPEDPGQFTDPPPTGGASPNDPGGGYNDAAGLGGGGGGDFPTDFARGGAVPLRRPQQPQLYGYDDGGAVPTSASPSGGVQTDDVPALAPSGPAHLNANEFVIPQDVALWKGQEFFQKMIDQSRRARMGASAKPTTRPMR